MKGKRCIHDLEATAAVKIPAGRSRIACTVMRENAMKQKAKQQPVTQDQVSAALARFLNEGGMIQRLPDQQHRETGSVGAEKYDAYESLADLSRLTMSGEQSA